MAGDDALGNGTPTVVDKAGEIWSVWRAQEGLQQLLNERRDALCGDRSDTEAKPCLAFAELAAELNAVMGYQLPLHAPRGAKQAYVCDRMTTARVWTAADVDSKVTRLGEVEPAAAQTIGERLGQTPGLAQAQPAGRCARKDLRGRC